MSIFGHVDLSNFNAAGRGLSFTERGPFHGGDATTFQEALNMFVESILIFLGNLTLSKTDGNLPERSVKIILEQKPIFQESAILR